MSAKTKSENTLSNSQVLVAMRCADRLKDSLMIWGPAGIGKSAAAQQYADMYYPLRSKNINTLAKLKKRVENVDDAYSQADYDAFDALLLDQATNMVDFRLSDIDSSDLRGIPVVNNAFFDKTTGKELFEEAIKASPESYDFVKKVVIEWAAPKALQLPSTWKGVIFFDEIPNAMPIVQAVSYQLILDRHIGELYLPDEAAIFGAGNREEDGGNTFGMVTPLRDRMTHIEMFPKVEEFLEDYAIPKRFHPMTIGFLKQKGQYLHTLDPKDPSHAQGASPRSWERVSEYENDFDKEPVADAIKRSLIAGRVGDGMEIEYNAYKKHMGCMPDITDVLTGKVTTLNEEQLEPSRLYFLTLSACFKLTELYDTMMSDNYDQSMTNNDWGKFRNFITFMLNNYDKSGEQCILVMTNFAKNNVSLRFDRVPEFKDFIAKYKDMNNEARKASY